MLLHREYPPAESTTTFGVHLEGARQPRVAPARCVYRPIAAVGEVGRDGVRLPEPLDGEGGGGNATAVPRGEVPL